MPVLSRRVGLLVIAVAAAAFLPYRDVPSLSYCGIDTPVLIEVNRFETPTDVFRLFGREIRDFVEPDVAFYRPWTALSYATDSLLYGTGPRGYHITDVLLHVAAAILLFLFLRSLRTGDLIAFVAASWFALHPLGVEVVPAQARRADLWASVLLLAACWGRLRDAAGRPGGRALWIAAGIAAPLSKETGTILPLLFVALPTPGPWWRRLLHGCALVVPVLVLRWFALDGPGGYGTFTLRYRRLPEAVVSLMDPAGLMAGWGGGLVVLLLGIGALVLLVRGDAGGGARTDLLVFGATWTAGMLLLAVLARGISAWYLYAPLPGVAAMLAGLLGSWRWPGRAAVGMAMAIAVLASPLWVDYPEWREVSREVDLWLSGSEVLTTDAARSNPDGNEPLLVVGLPRKVVLRTESPFRVRTAGCFMDYTLASALNLRTGVRPHVRAVARVDIQALGADYVIHAEPAGESVRVWASGPVELSADVDLANPRLQDWQVRERKRGGDSGVRVETNEDGSLLISGFRSPLWIWDGRALREFSFREER